ncbi:MAG: tetratricopeptide repeat protein, partial [bacterium]
MNLRTGYFRLGIFFVFVLFLNAGCMFYQNSPSEDILFNRGLAYESLAEYGTAAETYRQVVASRQKLAFPADEAALRLARLYANHLTSPDSAVFYYQTTLDNTPKSIRHQRLSIELAEYHRDRGAPGESLEVYRSFQQLYPDS